MGRAAITDPFLVERGLVKEKDAHTVKTIRQGEWFVCPHCGWKQKLTETEITSTEPWIFTTRDQ